MQPSYDQIRKTASKKNGRRPKKKMQKMKMEDNLHFFGKKIE
jgi:hypothetical protein